jgi:hypothetical protein
LDDDTDSDTSVRSCDVLVSNYPVKPRKYLKPPSKHERDEILGNDGDGSGIEDLSAEDVIEFLKTIETARRGVFEAEREKERLEIKYQVSDSK